MMRPTRSCLFGGLAFTFVAGCVEPGEDESGDELGDTETSTDGGDTDGSEGTETGAELGPTWHQDIAPIVADKCVGCHRAGGIGPFSMEAYESAAPWAELALDAMVAGEMPPWGQANTADCEPRMDFAGDPRLSDEEMALFNDWIAAGTPEGDPETAAPLPEPPELELTDADYELPIPSTVEVPPGPDQFWCFVIDPGFAEETFIDGLQINPGNDLIVHHALVYLDEAGESEALADAEGRYPCFGGPEVDGALISVWAPGVPPQLTPPDVAMRIPGGAKLVMQIHYHPTGALESDGATSLNLREAPGVPLYVGEYGLPGNEGSQEGSGYGLQPGPNDSGPEAEFRIPAGVAGHTERMLIPVPPGNFEETIVWQVGAHMHYLGVDMRLGIERVQPEEGTGIKSECFVQTPHYSFEWQRLYNYDGALEDMPHVKPGDVLTLDCTYDNSLDNPHVVEALAEQGLDAPVDVYLGDETLDEMCLGIFGIATLY